MNHKITQVSMFYLPIRGGQETYIENLHHILKKNDYESQVIQVNRAVDKVPSHVKFLYRTPHLLNKIIPDTDWFAFNFGLIFEKKALRQSDLIICHYPFHYPAISWHQNIIVLSHGVDWREPARTFADRYRVYALEMCKNKKLTIIANDTNFLRHLGLDIQPANSEFQQVSDRIWYIPNCVNTEQFKPSGVTRKNIILVPRNIRYSRGIHLAIQSFYEFVKHDCYREYEMWIAGTGQLGRYYRYCKKLINDLNLQESVKFIGHVPWQSLGDYYNQVKLTLIPTIELEGTSLSALESMACKTPVVSTSIAGLNDLPTIKTSLEPDDIANKMVEGIENWNYYSQFQYEKVLTTFNLILWKEAWLKVIEETLK